MNSSDKYIPHVVFAIGILLLSAAVFVFLSDSGAPSGFKGLPEPQAELSGIPSPSQLDRPWVTSGAQEAVASSPPPATPQNLPPSVSTRYLKRVGLSINLPDSMAFGETKAQGYQVLIGVGESELAEFMLFSIRRKMKPEKVKAILEEQFRDEGLRAKEISKLNSRGGVGVMTVIKGTMRGGQEFQAFAFTNEKSRYSHLLVLADSELRRQPARVRQIVDSITATR
jgi:hypothetical protein